LIKDIITYSGGEKNRPEIGRFDAWLDYWSKHDGGLAGVVEHQARKHDRRPRQPDRLGAEMTHVGVECLGPGDAEEDAAQDGKAFEPVVGEIGDRVAWGEPEQHRRMLGDPPDAQQGNGGEPGRHHRTEGMSVV
jgi:hypothetical protein